MRTMVLKLIAVVAMLLASSSAVLADDPPAPLKHATAGPLGEILTDGNGMTLYTFGADTEPGKSTCSATCASNWPPFRPESTALAPKAPLSVITREDGSKQHSYKGKPLYLWKNDKKPGDTTGHKFADRWFAATP